MKQDLVYLNMMVLSALCGKPAPNEAEDEAIRLLRVGIESGALPHLASYAQLHGLKEYKARARRACMRRLIEAAPTFVKRNLLVERFRIEALKAGVSREDARHVAAARAGRAIMLTWDKQLLDLRTKPALGIIMTPNEYLSGGKDGK